MMLILSVFSSLRNWCLREGIATFSQSAGGSQSMGSSIVGELDLYNGSSFSSAPNSPNMSTIQLVEQNLSGYGSKECETAEKLISMGKELLSGETMVLSGTFTARSEGISRLIT